MELPRPLVNLVDQANAIDIMSSERLFNLTAIIITPVQQITLEIPNGMAHYCAFGRSHSDDIKIKGQLGPGVYQQDILPYRDNLYIEVCRIEGYTQTVKRYRATPLGDSNPRLQGGSTTFADLKSKDQLNLITVTFQLMDPGYAILKNETVGDILMMTTLRDVLHGELTKYGETLGLTGADAFKGVDIEEPIDNDRIFRQVVIPAAPSVPLRQLGDWVQKHDEFGFYATGLGQYYRKGMWYIYPLFRTGRYEKAKKVLDVYRLPENVFPTLKNTYFVNGRSLTVLSTGVAKQADGSDIDRQNMGTGKRVVSSDAVVGEVGKYYGKGQALTTRKDSLSEFQTAKRASGEEIIPFHGTPTNNICKLLSQNAFNDGSVVTVSWHNSDGSLITPGMPVHYYYVGDNDSLMYKEGTVLTLRSECQMDTQSVKPVFREHSSLEIFLNDEEKAV